MKQEGVLNQNYPERPFGERLKTRVKHIEEGIQYLLESNSIVATFNELTATLPEEDIERLSKHPDVVFFESLRKIQKEYQEQIELIEKNDKK